MYNSLSFLGIPLSLQVLVSKNLVEYPKEELVFSFGDFLETYAFGHHHMAVSIKLYIASILPVELINLVIVSYSVMECLCYLGLNHHRYPNYERIAIVATGLRPTYLNSKLIGEKFRNARFILLFGNDILDHFAEILVAAGIKGFPAAFELYKNDFVRVRIESKTYIIPLTGLTLREFERVSQLRIQFRTAKHTILKSYLAAAESAAQTILLG